MQTLSTLLKQAWTRARNVFLVLTLFPLIAFYFLDKNLLDNPGGLVFPQQHLLFYYVINPTLIFLGLVGIYSLGPIPWQWNGRRPGHPPLWRGLLQSVIFSEAWIALLVALGLGIRQLAHVDMPRALIHWLYNLSLPGGLMIVVGGLLAWKEREEAEKLEVRSQAQEAQAQAQEAEALLLQSQLHPHVLFNSLNGLTELVRWDAQAAEEGMQALSGLLRKLMRAAEQREYHLWDERRIVGDYLAIESLRLGDRLRLQWHWDDQVDCLRVPPLLLQPLVENAIKHGISPHRQGGDLAIEAEEVGSWLRLRVRNNGRRLETTRTEGLGLRNLAARLALLFGEAARFRLFQEEAWTVAELHLDLSKLRAEA